MHRDSCFPHNRTRACPPVSETASSIWQRPITSRTTRFVSPKLVYNLSAAAAVPLHVILKRCVKLLTNISERFHYLFQTPHQPCRFIHPTGKTDERRRKQRLPASLRRKSSFLSKAPGRACRKSLQQVILL